MVIGADELVLGLEFGEYGQGKGASRPIDIGMEIPIGASGNSAFEILSARGSLMRAKPESRDANHQDFCVAGDFQKACQPQLLIRGLPGAVSPDLMRVGLVIQDTEAPGHVP